MMAQHLVIGIRLRLTVHGDDVAWWKLRTIFWCARLLGVPLDVSATPCSVGHE